MLLFGVLRLIQFKKKTYVNEQSNVNISSLIKTFMYVGTSVIYVVFHYFDPNSVYYWGFEISEIKLLHET